MKKLYALLFSLKIFAYFIEASDVYDLSKDWETSSSFYNKNEAYCAIDSVFWLSGAIGYVIIKDGEIVAEKYRNDKDQDSITPIWSSTKSFTGLLLGHLENQGLFTPNTTLGEIFVDDVDWEGVADTNEKKTITMEELLTFSSGLSSPALPEYDTLQNCLNQPYYPDLRGTFNYLPANHILSHIIYRLSGFTPQELAINSGIFAALGIGTEDYDWDTFGGIEGSAMGLHTSPRMMAKLGQLYLRNGQFSPEDDYTFISSDWVQESIKNRVPQDVIGWNFDSYGYQFATDHDGRFATQGYLGNDVLVFPEENIVVAYTTDTSLLKQLFFKGNNLFYSVLSRNVGKLHSQKTCSTSETPSTLISETLSFLMEDTFSYNYALFDIVPSVFVYAVSNVIGG